MPKCPNCEKEISLLYYDSTTTGNEQGDFDGEYKVQCSESDFDDITFNCPECNEELFHSCEDAAEFISSK